MSGYLLIAAVGGPNFGDEAILSTWINKIQTISPNNQIYCDGYNLNNLKKYVEGRALTIENTTSLWSLIRNQPKSVKDLNSRIGSTLRNKEFVIKLKLAAEELEKLNIKKIHICGGGYFNQNWPDNYLILLLAKLLGDYLNATVIATGQGLTPATDEQTTTLNNFLSNFDHIDCRDQASYDMISNNKNLSFTGDDALLFFTENSTPPILWTDKKSLIFCIQSDLFESHNCIENIVMENFDFLKNEIQIKQIILVEAMNSDIIKISNKIQQKIIDHGIEISIVNRWDALKNGFPLSKDGLLITSRYHPHFFAALSGAKGIALYSNEYYRVKHESVRSTGSNWQIIDFQTNSISLKAEIKNAFLTNPVLRQNDLAIWLEKKNEIAKKLILINKASKKTNLKSLEDWISFCNSFQISEKKYDTKKNKFNMILLVFVVLVTIMFSIFLLNQ